MKVFCFVFSLYALTLALTPCADTFCGGDDQHLSSVQHEDEKDEDLCSSFCICACCGYAAGEISITVSDYILAPSPSISLASLYRAPFVKDFSLDFWQPPKVG
jgi:hypothetical protein